MKTGTLELPFGDIQVLVNETPVVFEYIESSHNEYWLNDKEPVKATGALMIAIDPKDFKEGDIVHITSTAGHLRYDGGGEDMVNAIAELEEWTYGFGGPDTEFIEWRFGSLEGDITDPSPVYKCHVLDYELVDILESGILYRIVNGIGNKRYCSGKLMIDVVWESNLKDYAWDIVSFLTS